MASEKKPSIYSDRGTIGSAEELDEYGVWVKSEPQELSAESADDESTGASLPDFDMGFEDLSSSPDLGLAGSGGPAGIEEEEEEEKDDLFSTDLQIPEIDLAEAEADFREPVSRKREKDTGSAIEELPLDEEFNITFDEVNIPPGESLTEESDDLSIVKKSSLEESGVPEETVDLSPGEMAGFEEANLADEAAASGLEPSSEVPEETFAAADTSPELSTQLLMKIADELSSIRTELSHLKKEFAGIRAETEKSDTARSKGFFSEDDDEKITLTGDELDNIMNTVEFIDETGDPEVEDSEDLMSEPNDALTAGPAGISAFDGNDGSEEEIVIDFDDLGIDLNVHPDDFDKLREDSEGFSSLDMLGMMETPESETSFSGDLSIDLGSEDFVSDDLNALSTDLGSFDEDLLMDDSPSAEDPSMEDDAAFAVEEAPPAEDPSMEDDAALAMEEAPPAEDPSMEDDAAFAMEEAPAEDPSMEDDAAFAMEDSPPAEETRAENEAEQVAEDNISRVIRVLNSLVGEDNPPADNNSKKEENFFSDPPLLEDNGETSDSELLRQLQIDGAEPMTPAPEDTSYLERGVDDGGDGEIPMDISLDEDQDFDMASLDLSEAVIDEPDLSAGLTENPVEEPSLDEISLEDMENININLEEESFEAAMEGLNDDEDISISDNTGLDEIPDMEINLDSETGDDSFAQVIPEGFEAEAEKSPIPFDDDMDGTIELGEETALADEDGEDNAAGGPGLADDADIADAEPVSDGENMEIPAGLKTELKTVLSYMDQLLESLPEDKIEEFAKSEYFDTYKKLFKELGLV